jgi:hypothetical protein
MSKISNLLKFILLGCITSTNAFSKSDLTINIKQKKFEQTTELTSNLPSLELLLYLGEFQDKDGSLLEPEKFDSSLKIDPLKQPTTDETKPDESKTPQLTKVKKEDNNDE